MLLTYCHIGLCLVANLWSQSIHRDQVFGDEDVWHQPNHVLLATSSRNPQETVQTGQRRTHDVTYINKQEVIIIVQNGFVKTFKIMVYTEM